MKRRLSDKVTWDSETIKLEQLDWETNAADFNKLVVYVTKEINKALKLKKRRLNDIVSESEMRSEIWEAAKSFNEKQISLTMHVYLQTKSFVACKMRGGKWR